MSQGLSIPPDQLSEAIQETLRDMLQPVVELEILQRKKCLSDVEVEKLYGIPAATLRCKRCRGGGPPFCQGTIKGSVMYIHDDIQQYLTSIKKFG